MKTYIGTKIIQAKPMNRGDYNAFRGWSIPKDENPEDAGYLVQYPDGYVSWIPIHVFEEAYKVVDGLTFGLAIEALKRGEKVARSGWNGKGMYIQLHKGTDFEHAIIEPFLVIKNVKNSFNTWVPSISDLLAEDWEVVGVQ